MHGIIISELRKYVTDRLGAGAWDKVMKEVGKQSSTYLATEAYPDGEVVQLVTTAAKAAGKPVPDILQDFGEFIVPDLVKTYRAFIQPNWKTLDLLENAEKSIHAAVRMQSKGATPPALVCQRVSPNEVQIIYSSSRKMCGVAKGIAKGTADFYKEPVKIEEKSCMLKGAKNCTISVKKL